MTDIIKTSYSELQTWRECPQKWNYRYERGLTSQDTNAGILSRDLGTWMHAFIALDLVKRGKHLGTLKYAPEYLDTPTGKIALEDALQCGIGDALHDWAEQRPSDYLEAWLDRYSVEPFRKVMDMWKAYKLRWKNEDDALEPLAVEFRFSRPLGKTEGELRGVIDLVYRDTRKNIVVVQDHKCLTNIERTTSDDLMDSQLQLYAWAAVPGLAEIDIDAPRAVSYNRVRTVTPKTPVLTATGTLSKSVTDFDLRTYVNWALGENGEGAKWGTEGEFYKTGTKAGQPKFGRYEKDQKVIDALLEPDALNKWHRRTLQPVSLNVQRAHLRAAASSFKGSQQTRLAVEKFNEAPRSLTTSCRFCDYLGLCRAEMIGGPMGDYPLDELRLAVTRMKSQNAASNLTPEN